MSRRIEENVQNLRAFLEDWGRQAWTLEDWERGAVIDMSFFDPEVAYEDTVLPDHAGEVYRGHEGVVRAAKRWVEGSEWLPGDEDPRQTRAGLLHSTDKGDFTACAEPVRVEPTPAGSTRPHG